MISHTLTRDDTIFSTTRTLHVAATPLPSEIIRWTVPNNMEAWLKPCVLRTKLYSAGTTDLPVTAQLAVGVRDVGNPLWDFVIQKPYHPWASLTIAQQNDADMSAQIFLNFSGGGRHLKENEQIGVLVRSTTAVENWVVLAAQNSFIFLPIEYQTI